MTPADIRQALLEGEKAARRVRETLWLILALVVIGDAICALATYTGR